MTPLSTQLKRMSIKLKLSSLIILNHLNQQHFLKKWCLNKLICVEWFFFSEVGVWHFPTAKDLNLMTCLKYSSIISILALFFHVFLRNCFKENSSVLVLHFLFSRKTSFSVISKADDTTRI